MLTAVVLILVTISLVALEVLRRIRREAEDPDLTLNHRASVELVRQIEEWRAARARRPTSD